MQQLADELNQKHRIRVEVVAADLSREHATEEVRARVDELGMIVDLLVNNAGFGTHGRFHELDAARDHDETMLNVVALQDLTHSFLPGMIHRRDGGVINVASTAAFQPLPFLAVYGATKAFVLSFSEALWAEAKDYNVRVTALCPGATETPFFGTVGTEDAAIGKKDSPENVVAQALRAFEMGESYVIPRWNDWFLAQVNRFSTRSITARISKKLMRPGKNQPAATAKLNA